MLFGGIDEAGYGPLLGPLSICGVAAEAENLQALKLGFRKARTGAKDSKQVHVPGDIGAIESVALPAITWLSGRMPGTALECFSLLDETAAAHQGIPWLMEAAGLRLPVAAPKLKQWKIAGVEPRTLAGGVIQPREFNADTRAGTNRAEIELATVGTLLRTLVRPELAGEVVVDRLGGRRYYHGFLQSLWSDAMVLIEQEAALASVYRVIGQSAEQSVSFRVDGESASPMTAVASCIAKYVRELHMLLINRYWCALRPDLKPTAGYTKDAWRWLADVGEAVAPVRDLLVRNRVESTEDDDEDEPAAAAAETPGL
jgi:ribonuclease HII